MHAEPGHLTQRCNGVGDSSPLKQQNPAPKGRVIGKRFTRHHIYTETFCRPTAWNLVFRLNFFLSFALGGLPAACPPLFLIFTIINMIRLGYARSTSGIFFVFASRQTRLLCLANIAIIEDHHHRLSPDVARPWVSVYYTYSTTEQAAMHVCVWWLHAYIHQERWKFAARMLSQ